MKRFLFIGILFVLCLTSFQAHAQRYLPGMKGLQVTAGMADGMHWNDNTDFAYHIGAAYSVLHQERQPLGDWRGIPAQKV